MTDRMIFGFIGLLVGGLSGFLISGSIYQKQYKNLIDRMNYEISRLTEENHGLREDALKERERRMEEEAKTQAEEIIEENGYSSDNDDVPEIDLEEVLDFDDPFEPVKFKTPEKKKTFQLISQKDYEEDFDFRDNDVLTYYQTDGVLADAFDDPVSHAEDVVGEKALAMAQETAEDYLYVLDETENRMYEIEIEHTESLYRDVLNSSDLD